MVDLRLQVETSSPIGTLVFVLWGLIVWGLQFTASYVGHTFLCRMGAAGHVTDVLVAGLTVTALAALAPVGLMPDRMAAVARVKLTGGDRRRIILMARTLVGLAAIAVIWTATGLLFIDACIPR